MIGAQHKWLLWSQNVYLVVLSMSICHMMLPWGAILPKTGNSKQALQQKWMNHKIMIHTVHTVAILSENENVCTTCTTSQMYRKPVLLFSVFFCLLDRSYCLKIFIWTLFLKYLSSGATSPFSRELHMKTSLIFEIMFFILIQSRMINPVTAKDLYKLVSDAHERIATSVVKTRCIWICFCICISIYICVMLMKGLLQVSSKLGVFVFLSLFAFLFLFLFIFVWCSWQEC